jgi:subtilisin-like proprotein convertase family protein
MRYDLGHMAAAAAASCLLAGAAQASTATYASTDVPLVIPDNNATGISSTLDVSGAGPINDLNLLLNIRHTSVADLNIVLQAPNGAQVLLLYAYSEGGILSGVGNPDDFIDTIFDDEATTNLRNGVAPYTGSFTVNWGSILDPLASFDGLDANGTWTLFVSDRAAQNIGSLTGWSLQIDSNGGVPEPAAWALMIVGFGLAGAALRRRSAMGDAARAPA